MVQAQRMPGIKLHCFKLHCVLAAALVAGLAVVQAPAFAQSGGIITVPNQDAEMAEAQAKARATLSHFWDKLANPGAGEGGFALKVALPAGGGGEEHIWTKDVVRKDGKISSVINNVPRVKTVRIGQRIAVAETQISDWMYMRNGKIVGNYTMRPLLKRMPPQEAARYRAMLESP